MNFIVEHRIGGNYVMETIRGVEDIDMSRFKDLIGVWVTENDLETDEMERQLKELRNARSSK